MTTRSRPAWLPAAALATLVPAFLALGIWQLHRADAKHNVQDDYDRRTAEAPLRLGSTLQSADELRFHRLVARGKYDPDYQILIDNRVHHGVAGYEVVTPLKLEGSDTRVLVNRGWVPLGESRAKLPEADTPQGAQEITGIAMVPQEGGFTLSVPTTPGWQPVWPRLEMKRYGAAVPFAVQPAVILLDAGAPGGFAREWSRLDTGIAVHQGYALQWFALAALSIGGVIVMLVRTRATRSKKKRR